MSDADAIVIPLPVARCPLLVAGWRRLDNQLAIYKENGVSRSAVLESWPFCANMASHSQLSHRCHKRVNSLFLERLNSQTAHKQGILSDR